MDRCLTELKDWDSIYVNVLEKESSLLNIETLWKKSIENLTYHDLICYLENKQDWPTTMNWKVNLECRI